MYEFLIDFPIFQTSYKDKGGEILVFFVIKIIIINNTSDKNEIYKKYKRLISNVFNTRKLKTK